jgi:hypothetical protein
MVATRLLGAMQLTQLPMMAGISYISSPLGYFDSYLHLYLAKRVCATVDRGSNVWALAPKS